jgi:hypothetical protein
MPEFYDEDIDLEYDDTNDDDLLEYQQRTDGPIVDPEPPVDAVDDVEPEPSPEPEVEPEPAPEPPVDIEPAPEPATDDKGDELRMEDIDQHTIHRMSQLLRKRRNNSITQPMALTLLTTDEKLFWEVYLMRTWH